MSELHEFIKGAKTKSSASHPPIDLYERITAIKEDAKTWLVGLGKNGYEHSERLEGYLDYFTKDLREKKMLTQEETFILLCAVYMHDIGYRDGGDGHGKKSRVMICDKPATYSFGDFPPFQHSNCPRIAAAVGILCEGHISYDSELSKIPNDFTDTIFEKTHFNLRKLTALLRIADETDEPYIRSTPSKKSLRDGISLVEIEGTNIIIYWDRVTNTDPDEFKLLIERKIGILKDSIQYINSIGSVHWNFLLRPEFSTTPAFMAEKPVKTFVGRVPDLEELHKIIHTQGAGAVTGLRGAGGIGKTELARMYTQKYRNEYPGGVFWASLKDSTWKEEAGKIKAAAYFLDNPPVFPDKQTAIDSLIEGVLSRKDALLIIDSVDDAEDIIKPACSVLVTTRDESILHKKLSREAIYELKQLPDNDGIELLGKVMGQTRIDADRAGAVRLVEILGGMPLALDIAAKHLREAPTLNFSDYIGKVQNKIQELKIEDEKDSNVKVSLELSLDQLRHVEEGDKLLLLFRSGAACAQTGFTSRTLGTAAGLGDLENAVLETLVGTLYHRSLLEFSPESGRFAMHPLMRQIADEKLKSNLGEEKRVKKNHCTYFLNFTAAHNNDPQALIREKDGIWQALIQANELEDREEVCRRFIDYLSHYYRTLLVEGRYQDAFKYLNETNLINIDEIGEVKTLVALLDPLIEHISNLDDITKAIEIFEKALEKDRYIGDIRGEGADLGNMGIAYRNLGKYPKAIELFERELEISRCIGDIRGEGNALDNIGSTYLQLGEYRKAIEFYEKALEIARRSGNIYGEGNTLGYMGLSYAALGEPQKAIELYERQLEIARRIGDVQSEASALGYKGLAIYAKKPQDRNLFSSALLDLLKKIHRISYSSNIQDFIRDLENTDIEVYTLIKKFLNDVWVNKYQKETAYNIFEIFERYEKILFRDSRYRDHFIHQFQVFLAGLPIIDLFYDQINERYKEIFRNENSVNIEFSWLLASTFHDNAYLIQQINQWISGFFGDYLNIDDFPIYLDIGKLLRERNFQEYIDKLTSIYSYIYIENNLNYHEKWEYSGKHLIINDIRRFFTKVLIEKRDHGLFGSIILLDRIQNSKTTDGASVCDDDTFSSAILPAALSIALHNDNILLNDDFPIELSFDKDPLTFILVFCDTIQEWGRINTIYSQEYSPQLSKYEILQNEINATLSYPKIIQISDEKNAITNIKKKDDEIYSIFNKLHSSVHFTITLKSNDPNKSFGSITRTTAESNINPTQMM